MKYIRTKDKNNLILDLSAMVIPYHIVDNVIDFNRFGIFEIIKQADTIEELCDEFVAIRKSDREKLHLYDFNWKEIVKECNKRNCKIDLYGAIWTDKGLIYVAKMNSKGELELL